MEVVSAGASVSKDVTPITTTNLGNQDDPSTAYTIIRVKRKLVSTSGDDGDNSVLNNYQSFKRLRHLGSFTASASTSTVPPDEEAIKRNSLLKLGLSSQKRVLFNDLNVEQFSAYVETLGEKDRKKRKVTFKKKILEKDDQKEKSFDETGLFSIGLTQADFASPKEEEKSKEFHKVPNICNGAVLEEVSTSHEELEKDPQYVYDYYLMVDYVLSFEEPEAGETAGDDLWDADSNDENYRYNDYPDEDEFDSDDSDSSSSTNFGSDSEDLYDENGRRVRESDVDEDQDDYLGDRQYYDEEDGDDDEWIRDMERRMRRTRITDNDDSFSDGDSSKENEFD